MDDISIEYKLGSVWWSLGKLEFTLVVKQDNTCFMRAFAFDPSDLRKAGILLVMGGQDYKMLKDIVAKTESLLEELESTKNIKFTYLP
jgi:hypothetical protein